MSRYVMALDQGTTSSRAMLFDESGDVVAVDQYEFAQHFPKPGWVEHDAEEIWDSQLRAARGALDKAGASGADVAAIGITNQRETALVLTKLDGTAKGGVIVGLADEFGIPVTHVGVGEAVEDLRDFAAEEFVDALFGGDEAGGGEA